MIIDCISDLHGYYPSLEGGDLLIVAGDLTATHSKEEMFNFVGWLQYYELKYKKIVVIAGNHDPILEKEPQFFDQFKDDRIIYLCDSGTQFKGMKIWGSPWTLQFEGMNPKCMAFTCKTEEELAEKWKFIPYDTDILVTHSPMFSYLDGVKGYDLNSGVVIKRCGSRSLRKWSRELNKMGGELDLHVHGHIHGGYGECGDGFIERRVNASHVNECYDPVNKPIIVEL